MAIYISQTHCEYTSSTNVFLVLQKEKKSSYKIPKKYLAPALKLFSCYSGGSSLLLPEYSYIDLI